MESPPVFVTAQRWSTTMLEELRGHADGVILGDLFCQKRMFENEWFDVLDMAELAREIGFEVIFQTPAYTTPRSVEPTLSLVRRLAREQLLSAVMLHDVGLLQELSQMAGLELWWDRFSFNRDFIPNAPLSDFLRCHGISRVEVVRPAHLQELAGRRCGLLLYAFGPEIASFGRVCYTEYFLDEPCERKILCSRSRPFIASVDKVPLSYLADGYTLLDKDEPDVQLSPLTLDQAQQVTGITTYLRGPEEIPPMRRAIESVWSSAKAERRIGGERL